MAITDRRIQASKQRAIRALMGKVVRDAAASTSIGEFVRAVIAGDLAKAVAGAAKTIQPVSRVEIRKSEVFAFGEIPTPAPAEAAPAAEAEVPAEAPAASEAGPEAPEEPKPEEPAPEELTPEDIKDLKDLEDL